jgi:hypothetical protein
VFFEFEPQKISENAFLSFYSREKQKFGGKKKYRGKRIFFVYLRERRDKFIGPKIKFQFIIDFFFYQLLYVQQFMP